jgi:hypothetical protein
MIASSRNFEMKHFINLSSMKILYEAHLKQGELLDSEEGDHEEDFVIMLPTCFDLKETTEPGNSTGVEITDSLCTLVSFIVEQFHEIME